MSSQGLGHAISQIQSNMAASGDVPPILSQLNGGNNLGLIIQQLKRISQRPENLNRVKLLRGNNHINPPHINPSTKTM